MKKIAGVLLATFVLFCQSMFADQPTTVLTEVKMANMLRWKYL